MTCMLIYQYTQKDVHKISLIVDNIDRGGRIRGGKKAFKK